MPVVVERAVGGYKKQDKKSLTKNACDRDLVPSAPSIPSTFESRDKDLFITQENTAFGCSTKRFVEKKYIYPGPGQYHKKSSFIKDSTKCGSASIRGFTSMISLDPRFSDLQELYSELMPGPGAYAPSVVATKPSTQKVNFYKNRTADFKQKMDNSTPSPGPGHYGSSKTAITSNLGASSFKFTARKDADLLLQPQSQVAVGSYNVAESLDFIENIGKLPRKGKCFPHPIFSSNSSRLASSISPEHTPGPGHYQREPYLTYAMFRPSACFDTSLDRFGTSTSIELQRDETPGPDSYIPNPNLKNKSQYGAAASFASSCERFDSDFGNYHKTPGPGERINEESSYHLTTIYT